MPSSKRKYIREEWPKVQKVAIRGQIRFKVDGRPHKERLFFREKHDAEIQADVWARERENQGIQGLEFPTALRLEAVEASRLLKPFGKGPLDAARHYVAFLESEEQRNATRLVPICVDEWVKSKQAEAAKKTIATRTILEIEGRAKLFKAAFDGQRISEIDENSVRSFLDSLSVNPRTKQNVRTKFVQFLNFCRLKKWIRDNPAEAVTVRVPSSEVSILSTEEAKALLKAAKAYAEGQSLIPYICVSLFAGLRPGEAEQLLWENIHFKAGQIEVRSETSKTRETRFVKIEPTLRAWLAKYRTESGPIVGANFRKHWEGVRAAAGYSFAGEAGAVWPADVLRHSFGSYWLPIHADRPRLAEEMGNSLAVIKAHYRRAIPRKIAKAFWTLRPESVS